MKGNFACVMVLGNAIHEKLPKTAHGRKDRLEKYWKMRYNKTCWCADTSRIILQISWKNRYEKPFRELAVGVSWQGMHIDPLPLRAG